MHLDVVVSQVYWSLIVSIPWCWFVFFIIYLPSLTKKELPTSIQKPTKIDKVFRIALERDVDVAMLCVKRIPGQFKVADEVNWAESHDPK